MNEEAGAKANTFGTELKNDDGNVNGIKLNFVGGNNACPTNPTQKLSLAVNLMCGDSDVPVFQNSSGTSCDI
jgi:hypothetical protein